MDKFVAVVFNDEKSAYQGVRAFSQLNGEGSIDVAQVCVIQKQSDGKVSTKEPAEGFPILTLAGTAVGSLIGILAGPAGIALGAATGAYAGMMGDLYSFGVDQDFVSDVAAALTPGKCAVIAEIDEEWVTPLDTRMEALGGVVYRAAKSTVQEDQWKRENAAAKAHLEQLKIEHARAQADRKAKLQAQIESLNKRIEAKLGRAQARSEQATREFEAKLGALQRKVDQQQGEAKAAVAARMAKLRTDYQSRSHAQ